MHVLQDKYADRDVEFITMYVREPHPGETGFKAYRKHESYEHKVEVAKELIELKDVTIPLVVDGFDEAVHEELGNLPNFVYVVDKNGIVQFKATWLDAADVDRVLAELVTTDDPNNPVEHTMTSTAHYPAKI